MIKWLAFSLLAGLTDASACYLEFEYQPVVERLRNISSKRELEVELRDIQDLDGWGAGKELKTQRS